MSNDKLPKGEVGCTACDGTGEDKTWGLRCDACHGTGIENPPTHAADEGWGIQYWQRRCKAAEVLIKKYYKNIPDCSEYQDWQDTIDSSPPQQSAEDAVAFAEWIAKNNYELLNQGWTNRKKFKPEWKTTSELYAIYSPPVAQPAPRTFSVEEAVDAWESGYDYRSSLEPEVIKEFGASSCPDKQTYFQSLGIDINNYKK